MKTIKIIILAALTTSLNAQNSQKLNLKESKIAFVVKHDFQTTSRGKFSDFKGAFFKTNKNGIEIDSIAMQINANSISSTETKKDLKSSTYLDVKKYPTIKFNTIKAIKNENGKTDYVAEVLITMKGIQKKIEFKAIKEPLGPNDPSGRLKLKAVSNFDGSEFGFPVNDVLKKEGKPAGEEIIIDFHLIFDPVKQG